MNDVLTLISVTKTRDALGVSTPEETNRAIFCDVESIGSREFFDAGRNGLNPELVFIVFFDDYEGETIAEYKGNRYGIYRTYRDGDRLELYAERQGGKNGADN